MIGIVPLAGPDFDRADGRVKALVQVEGQPLLRRALESRSWWRSGALKSDGLVFVLRDTDPSRAFAGDVLACWYPDAQAVFLSVVTGGAALSALAGLALMAHREEPVCIDLVDLVYEDEARPLALFANEPKAGALGLCFTSNNPVYSYLDLSYEGIMLRSREKAVISSHASAGTYFFRSPSLYMRAVAHSLHHRGELAYRNLMYVCPTLNGVVAEGLDVHVSEVSNVFDVKVAHVEADRPQRPRPCSAHPVERVVFDVHA